MEFASLEAALQHQEIAAGLDNPVVLPDPVARTRPCWRLQFRGKLLQKPLPTKKDAEGYRDGLIRNGTYPDPGPYPEVVKGVEEYWTIDDVGANA